MAIDDKTLQSFFNKQKKPKISALVSIATKKVVTSSQRTQHQTNFIQNIDDTTGIKLVSNEYQTDTKPVPNRYQTDTNLNKNWYQTDNKTDTKTSIKLIPNQYQTDTKTGFFSLAGLQKKITILIYNLCKISRDKKTDAVSISQISYQCKSTIGAVKIAIHRLIDKNILLRNNFKNGRGGWTVYSIPDDIYQEILNLETQNKLIPNWYQTDTKVATELISEVIPSPLSSSSYNLLNKTTSTSEQKKLNDEWGKIEIEPLSQFGFTNTHLMQIAHQNLLIPDVVQASIYAFAFDLEHNDKAKYLKRDPLNYFMGILRNGKPYAPPANYESPRDRAMRLYLERIQELNQKRENMLKEAQELAFTEWFDTLSEEEKKELLPQNMRQMSNKMVLTGMARNHFLEAIWPTKEQAIMASTANPETQNESEETTMAT